MNQISMEKTTKYQATYTDDFGTTDIVVETDFRNLYFEIYGVKFEALEFGDFELIETENNTQKQLDKFTFFSTAICNYNMKVYIPQTIIDQAENKTFTTNLLLEYILGKPNLSRGFDMKLRLSLTINEQNFEVETDCYISDAFHQIIDKIGNRYKLKNCYGCLYSDYNPYSQAYFGGMYCFLNKKEKYVKLNIPEDSYKYNYFEEFKTDFEIVQETYCCDNYETRIKGIGYRG